MGSPVETHMLHGKRFNNSESLNDTRQHYAATNGGKMTNGLPKSA